MGRGNLVPLVLFFPCCGSKQQKHRKKLQSENILKAKLEITDGLNDDSCLIINQDNDMLQTVDIPRLKVVRVGKHKGSQILAKNIDLKETTSTFVVQYGDKEEAIDVPVQGEHNISNALTAIAVGLELGIEMEAIKKGIQSFELTKNRMDILEKANHITVIDGTYNASVDSMKSSIDVLSKYKRRKVAILADMLELGNYSEKLHRVVGQYIVDKKIDVFICVGKEAYYMYDEAKKHLNHVLYYEDNQQLVTDLKNVICENDVVLVKGSHSMNLKEVVDAI